MRKTYAIAAAAVAVLASIGSIYGFYLYKTDQDSKAAAKRLQQQELSRIEAETARLKRQIEAAAREHAAMVAAEKAKPQDRGFDRIPPPLESSALQAASSSSSFGNVRQEIRNNCISEWDGNYVMIRHCVESQLDAFRKLSRIPLSHIKSDCESEWGDNYILVEHCFRSQSDAARRLGL